MIILGIISIIDLTFVCTVSRCALLRHAGNASDGVSGYHVLVLAVSAMSLHGPIFLVIFSQAALAVAQFSLGLSVEKNYWPIMIGTLACDIACPILLCSNVSILRSIASMALQTCGIVFGCVYLFIIYYDYVGLRYRPVCTALVSNLYH